MTVKLIAVDMDGTFLRDDKTYHRERFLKQYAALKARGIRFVVASGNQYYQLTSFFPEIADEIAFVAENGAWVVCEGEDVFNGELSDEEYRHVIDHLMTLDDLEIIACGKNSGYTLNRYDERFKEMASRYYHRLAFVDDLHGINDIFFKFALNLPDIQLLKRMDELTEAFEGIVVPVSSGHGSIDLIIPGLHKANGIQMLQQRWGIADSEVVAFGDGGNDVEMLRHAGFGFAMDNAPEAIHKVAPYRAPANNQDGVLEIIDKVLNGDAPFA
ncbi:HAD family hydrolase [Cronobacter turicensis]|uniref:Cof-type HAD-IIB family hydrolase n=1 Tax=Cronobacter turicensis TaxID=413502 RepID=UPI0024AF8433|nr:Cof-type HAD-IIB family hydrolase [Cronobacter turicensis]MEB8540175.1 Cof-type HAD-IIB family hydrolase [Cronobacter sakazakii]EKM0526659.1 HAD family hydrolase [Cronobacter turicensis]EKM0666373.1 HAD family hydrolase [Cronobacter turicensis]EKY3176385.1 HAD family hydrolase [Cronobacter turicensis]ELQ5998460.1 HAD family hydrolase [Cronobacter turicensis]